MNVVRFKLKSECVDQYFEIHKNFVCEGITDRYISKTGDYSYCFVGFWESEEVLIAARPKMIAHLDEVSVFMEELSLELSVSGPISETIIASGI